MSDKQQPHHFEVGQGGSASSPSAEEEGPRNINGLTNDPNHQGLFSDHQDQQQQQLPTLTPQQQQALRFLDHQALYLNMTPEEQHQLLIQQQWLLLLQQMQMQQGGAAQPAAQQQPLTNMNMPQHVMSPLQMSPLFQNQFMGMGMMGSQHQPYHQQPSNLFASMASMLPAQAINTTSTYSSNLPAAPIAAATAAAPSLQLSNNSQPSIPGMFSSSFPLNPLAQINMVQNNTVPQVDLSDPNQALRANIRQYFLSIGLNVSQAAIEEIVSADESTYGRNSYFDSDDEDEDDDPNSATPSRKLIRLVEDHHWVAAIERISTHPRETSAVGIQGRTPLHVACDHDAPAAIVQALLAAWPEGAERVGTSYMNPLHITCSSAHASIDVVRVLLTGCRDPLRITGAKDVDGDTPLHAACRIGAPMDVLITLLHANPVTVLWNDYEGLNPLMRLWVRYYVLVGETIISNLKRPSDLTPDLVEAWERTVLLLQVMKAMDGTTHQRQLISPFLAVHASSHVNCPRCVVRMAMVLFPEQLLMRDEGGFLPIHIAAAAPVYAVHDLRGEGYSMDDTLIDEETGRPLIRKVKETKYKEPSVIDILLTGEPSAARERDPNGQLPLHVAIMRGKTLEEGVKALADAYPEALTMPDKHTNLFPFMLAASVGRGRGDCSTIYEMVRAAPELVKMALDHSSSSSTSPTPVPSGGAVNNENRSSFVDNDELSVDLDQKPRAKESLDQKPSATNNEGKQE